MKILFVSDLYYPHLGGISEHIFHLANEFEKMGHNIRILTGNMEGTFRPDEYRVIRIGYGKKVKYNGSIGRVTLGVEILKLKKIIKDFDVVHAHGGLSPTLPILALCFSKKTNFLTFHATFDRCLPYKLCNRQFKSLFNRIDGKIAVSKTAKESFSRYFPGDYKIIPNGIDIKRFHPMNNKRENTILFVGRIEKRKGLEYLLDALRYVKKEIKDVKLLIAGERYANYKIEFPEEIKENIVFLGFVKPDKLPEIYSSSNVFVSPAIGNESFGIVLLEAMASGTPVIASDIQGYQCVINDGIDGILFKQKDSKALADKIIEVLKNKNLQRILIQNGLKKAKKYAWENISREILEFYYEINPELPRY